MEVLLLLVMGMVNIFCFMAGAKVGQAVAKGEEVKLPAVKPADKPVQPAQTEEEQRNRLETIMRNIDKYDGTEQGQEDVPWR